MSGTSISNNITKKIGPAVFINTTAIGVSTTLYTAPSNSYAEIKIYADVVGGSFFLSLFDGSFSILFANISSVGTTSITVPPGISILAQNSAGSNSVKLYGITFVNSP